ncbi:conserved hypothetical protein [uncultured Sporomusa sp.]|uniref:Uncharacterized protein n=1 Tax=uncultured Sporomusa sp. TaxID=307249 RepID=A0A212LXX9_9FIRM|nr:hypothetical protein [uncultured Sporomusa sp.]SCM82381.1 conserved hypothetical protein [uncultured Sporomusa sp.]
MRAIFKAARKLATLSQIEAHFKTGIALKRLQRIECGDELPQAGEVKLFDKVYGCNGMLVLQYCGTTCPDGKYAGLEFESISPQSAGIKLITHLASIESLLPEIADTICEVCDGDLKTENKERFAVICAKLSQLRRYIMSIEVLMVKRKLPQKRELKNVRDFAVKLKEKSNPQRVAK